MIYLFDLYNDNQIIVMLFSIIYKWMEEDYFNLTKLIQTLRNLVHESVGDIIALKIIMYIHIVICVCNNLVQSCLILKLVPICLWC